jgi:PAS domain S-box-containing protein
VLSSPSAPENIDPSWSPSAEDVRFAELLTDSYHRCTGRSLLSGTAFEGNASSAAADELAVLLYHELPFALLSHDTSPDPRFQYANVSAQRYFGYSWTEFVGMPSRLSAEPANRGSRQKSMESALRDGFVDDYRGVRIAKSGHRFRIEQATIWNLVDLDGRLHGQAAVIREVQPLDP